MGIKDLKKELGLKDKNLAEFFGYKNKAAYYYSSARERHEQSFIKIYEFLKREGEKEKKKT